MELSVLPGRHLAISAHRLPIILCARKRRHYSIAVHWSFLMWGLRWLCHRSRHCLPTLPASDGNYPVDSQQLWSISAGRAWPPDEPRIRPPAQSTLAFALPHKRSTPRPALFVVVEIFLAAPALRRTFSPVYAIRHQ